MKSLCCLLLIILISGCSNKVAATNDKLQVYTSFQAIYNFAQMIGQDKISLKNLVPNNTEPHSWEPSTGELIELENADILLYNGLGMENWIEKVKQGINNDKITYIQLSDYVNLNDNNDSHVWLNPQNAKKQLEAIKDCYIEKDNKNADLYSKNYKIAAEKIDILDEKYKDILAKASNKSIVVSHGAYGYLCDTYGLKQVSIQGSSAEQEPTPTQMAKIIDFIRSNNIHYIFYDELSSRKAVDAISEETGVGLLPLNSFEGLTLEQAQNGTDYFAIMEQNLRNLELGLS